MRKNKWTDDEINFLIENYSIYGKEYCANSLKRNGSSVFKKASRLGLKVDKAVKTINNKLAQIKYQDERLDNTFNINVGQFTNISKPEVAYVLGFLWADGYIVRNDIRLEILKSDMDVIKPILNSLGTWVYSERTRNDNKPITRATTSNRRLVEFLKEHDYDKKSYVSADKILSTIPDELKHYWFRGLVDGDGCIYVNEKRNEKKVSISGSVNQNWSYVKNICDEFGISFNVYQKIGKHSSSVFEINGGYAKTFCDYIYQDTQFGLDRKYNKYLILTDLHNNSKRTIDAINKSKALSLHNNGIPITKIIKVIGIPSTTLRRFLNSVKQKW